MAGESVKSFGKVLRQRLGGADQGVHARDMENGAVQVKRLHHGDYEGQGERFERARGEE